MRHPTKLTMLTLALALAACGDDKGSENEADTGTGGQDASSGAMDSGRQDGGNDAASVDGASTDAQSSSDAGSDAGNDSGGGDAGSDAGNDSGGGDAAMDAAALAFAQGGKISALDAAASDAQG